MLAPGPSGAWDSGQLQTFNHPLQVGGKLRVYYGAFETTHGIQEGDGAIGLATLRKDGFVSLDAGSGAGVVTTRLLTNLEGELRLNADAGAGEIRVEVLDRTGEILPGYGRDECRPMSEDGIDFPVRWRAHEKLPRSPEPLRLRFVLTRASLFSFRAGEPVRLFSRTAPLEVSYSFESFQGDGVDDQGADDGVQPGRLHGSLAIVRDPDADPGESSALRFRNREPARVDLRCRKRHIWVTISRWRPASRHEARTGCACSAPIGAAAPRLWES